MVGKVSFVLLMVGIIGFVSDVLGKFVFLSDNLDYFGTCLVGVMFFGYVWLMEVRLSRMEEWHKHE